MPVALGIAGIGGSNYLGGASPLTANDTTIFYLPPPVGRAVFYSFSAAVDTVPIDADGTILARVRKYDASANAWVTVSQDIDLEALTTKERNEVLRLATATDAELILDTGDILAVHVVNNSAAIGTQPVNLAFTAQVLMQE
jgi:hypothetical protein